MTNQQLEELAVIIDNALDQKNEQELKLIIGCNQDYVERIKDSTARATLYYFLANAWSGLRHIRHDKNENTIWDFEQKEINQEVICLRKAKNEQGFAKLRIDYQCSILTNLANIFNHAGRTVYALQLYNRLVAINENFFMALLNRGECFETYASMDYDTGHSYIFLNLAYHDFQEAASIIKLNIDKFAGDKAYYEKILFYCLNEKNTLERMVDDKTFLNKRVDLHSFELGKSKDEKNYRLWVLRYGLFLNSLNDIGNHPIASHDPLCLPDMITEIDLGFPKYITYFNQIKEEFIAYRHLLYEGIEKKTKNFYDKETSIIDDYDYNLYEIHIEKIKMAFRGFYSIFDKIAYFLNEYFALGFQPDRMDFLKIRNNQDKLQKYENLALRGLYFISKDLFFKKDEENFTEILEPDAERINIIRNHLEHKFLNIKLLDPSKYGTHEERERIESITEEELMDKSVHLARLAREAILYLSYAVHIEEKRKDPTDKRMPFYLDNIEYLKT